MTKQHVMVDLETLSTKPSACILSIGAAKFRHDARDPNQQFDCFHVGVSAASCQRVGLHIEAGTVMWWLTPGNAAAREALLGLEQHDLRDALEGFSAWFGEESLPVWGNGASFDNVILRTAYQACGIEPPWAFWDARDCRTIYKLAPDITVERLADEVAHDALADAKHQARRLLRVADMLQLNLG